MKSKIVLVLLSLMSAGVQAGVIKGKIKDAQTGEEIIGASVIVKEDPGKGTVTGLDGSFNLSVNRDKYTLVCSYVGYKKYEVSIAADKKEIVIPLKSDDVALDEVVVVGYGVQKKSSLTGAVSSVKSEDMEARTITRAEQALQGKTAGVQVLSASAKPGASPQVRIRGISSNGSCDPP